MKKRYTSLTTLALLLVFASGAYAQEPTDTLPPSNYKPVLPDYRGVVGDSTVIPDSRMDQQKRFEEGTYMFPPKPRNKWEIGVHGGGFFISGDVSTRGGWGVGASVRKSLGYALSLQGHYMHGTTYGLNWQANGGIANNPVLTGRVDSAVNYTGKLFYYNYKTVGDELSGGMVLTLNNLGFHKKARERKVNMYAGLGGGVFTYRTWHDALDANGAVYDFDVFAATEYEDRKQTLKALKQLLDGDYETLAEGHKDQPELGDRVIKPVVTGSLGIGFHLAKNLQLTITEKFSVVNDDLLDGNRWQEHPYVDPALTRDFDSYHYLHATLGYFIGGKNSVEPLYWQNPMDYTYDALNTLMKKNVDELIDTDDDGVLDKLDKEPSTAAGAIVDTHGVTQDSDKDGVPDHLDKEPFSRPGAEVNSDGVALVSTTGIGGNFCNMTTFPSVHFELNKFFIQPEFYAHIYEIAMAMLSCPDKKMVAIGHADVRFNAEHNDVLSWERVNRVVDYLVTTYGIPRERFIVEFRGEREPVYKGMPERLGTQPMYESRQYTNRRVEFRWAAEGQTGESSPARPKGPAKAGREY